MVKEGNFDLAVREYKTFLSENPSASEIYEELANLRLKQGKPKFAIINFQLALKYDENSLIAREGLALAYEKGNAREKALIEWRKLANQSDNLSTKKRSEEHIKFLLEEIKKGNSIENAQSDTPSKKKPQKKSKLESSSKKDSLGTNGDLASDSISESKIAAALQKKKEQIVPLEKRLKNKNVTPLTKIIDENKNSAKKIPIKKSKLDSSSITKNTIEKEKGNQAVGPQAQNNKSRDIYQNRNFLKAIEYHNKGQNKKAIIEIRKALKTHPGHPGAYYYGGVTRYEMGQLKKAAYNFKKGLKYPDMGFNGYFYLGRIHQKNKEYTEAIDAYEKYVERTESEKGKKDAQVNISEIKKIQEASRSNKKVSAGYIKVSENPNPEVIPITQDFVFYIPNKSNAKVKKLGQAANLFTEGKLEKSLTALKEISRDYGGSLEADAANLNMAVVYLRLGLNEKALNKIKEYQSSRSKKVFSNQAEFLKVKAYIGLKNWDVAEKNIKKIKQNSSLGPSLLTIQKTYFDLYANKSEPLKALGYLEKILKTLQSKSDKLPYIHQKINLLREVQKPSLAVEKLKTIVKACPDKELETACASASLSLAEIYYKSKKWSSAKKHYREFKQQYPENKQVPWTLYQIANIDRESGRYKQALAGYQLVMEKYPDSYWSTQAKWKRDDAIWQNEYKGVLD